MKPVRAALLFVLTATTVAFAAGNGYKLFQQALAKERAEADLRGAIQIYEQVVKESAADRKLAAQALFRIGECQSALGDAEARKAYERVVSDYADQKEVVAEAQIRLAAMRPAAAPVGAMSARQIWAGPFYDSISGDGRLVSFTDWSPNGKGNLAVRDLAVGASRLLTQKVDGDESYADGSLISPDGRLVAYLWSGDNGDNRAFGFQIRIVSTNGATAPRIVHRSPNYSFVNGWTPDHQHLLISRSLEDKTWQIAMLSVADGSIRQLKSLKWGHIGARLSPDGRYIAYDAPVDGGPARDIFILAADGSRETIAVQHPANDHSAVWSADGSRILFMSDRTATPSVWSIAVKDGKPVEEARIVKSDTGEIKPLGMTLAGTFFYSISGRSRRNVYRAALGDDGKVSGSPAVVTDQYVNSNWGGALSPSGEELAYYSLRPQQKLVVRNLKSGQERVFPIEVGRIPDIYYEGPQWFPDGRSMLLRVRQDERPGNIWYRVDIVTGDARRINVPGGPLAKVAHNGKSIFHRPGGGSANRLARIDLETEQETVLRKPPRGGYISDLAISPDGRKLAYNLQVREGDEGTYLFVMPVVGGQPRLILKDSLGHYHARFNTLAWTPDQRFLLFVKDDESPNSSIWRVPVVGGEAERIGVRMEGIIKAPQLNPDGKSIYFTKLGDGEELWALENFLPVQMASK